MDLFRKMKSAAIVQRISICLLIAVSAVSAHGSVFDSVRVSIERRPIGERFDVMEHHADSLLNVDPYAAIPFTKEAAALARERGDKTEEGYLLNSLSKAYLALGEFEASGEYARAALALNIEVNHEYEIARTYNITAVTYNYMGLYTNAMEYSLKALAIYAKLGKKNQAAIMLNAIGTIYLKLSQFDKAELYFNRSLTMIGKEDTSRFALLVLNNIASIGYRRGYPDSSIHRLEPLLALARKRGEKGTEAYSMQLLGEAYCEKKQYPRALALLRQARGISSLLHEGHGEAEAMLGIARVYSSMGDHRHTLAVINEAIPYCRRTNAFELLRTALNLQQMAYQKQGDIRQAYAAMKAYKALTDSVFMNSEKFGIANAKFSIDLSQKESEIARLRRDSELVQASNEKKQYLIDALGIFVLVVVGTAIGLMFMVKKANRLHKIELDQKKKIESLFVELSKVVRDRDLADEQAHELQRKFQAVWEKSVDGMRLTDADGVILMVNESFCSMVGMDRDDLTGEPISIIYRPESKIEVMRNYRERFKAGDIERYFEREFVLSNNRNKWLEVTNTFIEIDGQPPLLFGIFRDISQRKKLELQLVQAQKLEGIGTLAGGIAHDFNNLLAMILGSAEMLKGRIAELPQLEKYVDRIVEASTRGASISRQLLIFSRPDQAELKPISLGQTIDTLHEMLKHFLPKSIEIVTNSGTSDDVIMGDAGQIQQALLNLAINAGDAMGNQGTLTFGIHSADAELIKTKFNPDAVHTYLALTVRDTGSGMDETVRSKIFDPFFTTKERNKGTGLGLSSVHGIVKNHNGFIDVESAPGQGSVFTLYFPAAAQPIAQRMDPTDPPQRRHSATVLLVDDERMLRETIAEFMLECGYHVHSAEGGNEAIELFTRHLGTIDVVVTDLGMPAMGGEELFTRLRAIDPEVKVIVSSGYLDGTTKAELLRMGVKDVLTKPVKMNEIQMSIDALLSTPQNSLSQPDGSSARRLK
jgi:PAS domain S-box-containing protein